MRNGKATHPLTEFMAELRHGADLDDRDLMIRRIVGDMDGDAPPLRTADVLAVLRGGRTLGNARGQIFDPALVGRIGRTGKAGS